MDNPNVTNLAAALINDKRYSELKTAVYEDLVNKDHATVVAVFRALQEYATDAEQNSFNSVDSQLKSAVIVKQPSIEIDPDLDDSLLPDEISLRK
jgi:hypothetical protein